MQLECVIAELQVQLVSMAMSILHASVETIEDNWSDLFRRTNNKNPCGWTRNYMLILLSVYSKADKVMSTMEILSNMEKTLL